MNSKWLLTVALILLPFDASAFNWEKYSSFSKGQLVSDLHRRLLLPDARNRYATEVNEFRRNGIEWEDVAAFEASCATKQIALLGSRTDIEIIHYLWVVSRGREEKAKTTIIRSRGRPEYTAAVSVYSGASFDCMIATRQRFGS